MFKVHCPCAFNGLFLCIFLYTSCTFTVIYCPGLCPGSVGKVRAVNRPECEGSHSTGWQWWWSGKWQEGHKHLTLEKQSDTKGFNAMPWVWATAIGFDSRVIMRGGRLEVRGLDDKRGDVEKSASRGNLRATLDRGLSHLLDVLSSSHSFHWFPFT